MLPTRGDEQQELALYWPVRWGSLKHSCCMEGKVGQGHLKVKAASVDQQNLATLQHPELCQSDVSALRRRSSHRPVGHAKPAFPVAFLPALTHLA
ncbi:hypothetical protein RRG08_033627 [Elysia crispata]|uniref:Uncharacterized protein n=1 Tax=Elysia crispata TaxID=231223 RepID=A0AAE0XQX8_9GAST|nr:hypothetical protein RRG08_033627 [Elysia crispata]